MKKIIQLAITNNFVKREVIAWNKTDHSGNLTLRWFLIVKYGIVLALIANIINVLINF
jgi:hypothetical protein